MKTFVPLFALFLLMSAPVTAQRSYGDNDPITKKVTLSGNIRDKKTGETLIGATVYIKEMKTGGVSDLNGNFSIELQKGVYRVSVSYTGYQSQEHSLQLFNSVRQNFELEPRNVDIGEVVISGKMENQNIEKNEMGTVEIKMEQIKSIPALMGEADVIKTIQMMPGVQSSGEGFSGFNVRGGGSEQNLVLLDEAPVYNASHLMGFFSVFNNDALSSAKLYKGDIPASEGGRLSSLLEIRMKEDHADKLKVNGGIGTISSRLTLEGPIAKDKASFLLSGRRSYADVFLALSKDSTINKNKLYFYDLNLKLNWDISARDKLSLSSYKGRDVYGYDDFVGMNWGNNTASLKWNHIFSDRLYMNNTAFVTDYNYDMTIGKQIIGFNWNMGIRDYGIRSDYTFFVNTLNTVRFGFSSVYHYLNPGTTSNVDNSDVIPYQLPENRALENGLYLLNEQKVNKHLSLEYGIRFSSFHNVGEATLYHYNGQYEATDSTVYESGDFFHTYGGLEPRIGANYKLNDVSSFKAFYSRTRQYLNLASNSQGGTPLDIWFPCSPNVKPQIADQYSVGYFRNLLHNTLETSVEVYYKDMQNQVDFRDNAILMMNPKLEGELRFGHARACGAEFFVRKQKGKLTGWVSYTLSRSERRIEGINDNAYYPSSFDKTHNLTLVGTYEISKRLSASASWVYVTGAPVTIPSGSYVIGNMVVPVYSERNGYRLPDYHRLDLSVTLKGKEKTGKRYSGEWNFSVYNAYNRHNAFSLSFEKDKNDPEKMVVYKVYMFPVIPAITYNFKF